VTIQQGWRRRIEQGGCLRATACPRAGQATRALPARGRGGCLRPAVCNGRSRRASERRERRSRTRQVESGRGSRAETRRESRGHEGWDNQRLGIRRDGVVDCRPRRWAGPRLAPSACRAQTAS
jgi:hypothetical protein